MNHGLENRWLWAFASSASNETGAALSEQWNGDLRLNADWVNRPAEDVRLAPAG
jgi:hypothetical protein